MKKYSNTSIISTFIACCVLLLASVGWADTSSFTSAGTYTWTCPLGVSNVQVQAWGGGGAGGSAHRHTYNSAGGGGGGGAYAASTVSVTPGTAYTIVVGGGGPATTATTSAPGTAAPGTNSSFGSTIVVAAGGGGGSDADNGYNTAFGNGGTTASSTGTIKFAGGNGQGGSSSHFSGGGGSSAGTGANGNNASGSYLGGAAPTGGGAGGNGVNGVVTAVGSPGQAPGGAGGAGANYANTTETVGGNGAAGQVILTFTNNYAQVNVETAADGSGSLVALQNVSAGNSITVYSIGRTTSGSGSLFISNAPAVWSLVNISGNVVSGDLVPAGDNRSAVFTAHLSGSAKIQAVVPGLTGQTNASGLITVPSTGVIAAWTNNVDSTWTGGTLNWNPSVPSVAGDTAILGVGTALRTVTLNANESLGTLSLTNPNSFVVTGSSVLTMDNGGSAAIIGVTAGSANAIQTSVALKTSTAATVSGGNSLTISGDVSNAPSVTSTLTFAGTGTLVLSGNNNYGPSAGSVGTTLSGGGTLSLGNSSALGAGDLNVSANGTIQAGASVSVGNNITIGSGVTATVTNTSANSLTLGGIIGGGSGNLTKTGNGTLTFSGANTYGGTTTVGGGTVSITADNNLGAVPGSATANSIILNGGDLLGNGTPDLNANRGVGIGPVSGATGATALVDATSGSTFIIEGNIASAGNTSTNNLTINSGAGNNGSVILSGTNTFNGTTVIANGVLSLSNSLALQNSTLNYNNQGGTLDFGSLTAATLGGLSGAQNLTLNNFSSAALALTVGNNGFSNYYSGVLSGTGSLVKNGSGVEVLNGANTYSGVSGVSTGVLQLNSSGVISNPAAADYVSANAGAELFVNGGSFTANSFNVAAPSVGLLVGSGSASILGALTMNAGNSSQAAQSSLVAVTGGSLFAASFAEGRNAGSSTAQPTTGSTAIGFYVNGGSVIITNNVSICTQGGANSGNSMRIDSGSLTVGGSVTVAGGTSGGRWSVFDVAGGTLTVNDTTTGINIGGNNAGSAELLIRGGTTTAGIVGLGLGTGAGTVVLNQTNGSLYIGSGGIVQQGSSATVSITLNGGILGATADWSETNNITLGGTTIQCADASGTAHNIALLGFLGGTTLTKSGAGTLVLTNSTGNGYTGLTTISNGTVLINSEWSLGGANYAGLTFAGSGGTVQYANPTLNSTLDLTFNGTAAKPVTISAPATIDVNGANVNFSNPIGNSGSGSLTVLSTTPGGVLSLNGTNTYTGATTIDTGVTLGGNNIILGNVTVNGSTYPGINSAGASATNLIGGNLTYAGAATGCTFDVGASVGSVGNDRIILTNTAANLDFGSGSAGSFTINIANGANVNLDVAHDYVLFKVASATGHILNAARVNATPNFTGSTPTYAANFSIVTTPSNVVLHASGVPAPIITSATATPNPLLANQTVTINVGATAVSAPIDPNTGVVVDLSSIGGSSTQPLIYNGAGHYTNSFTTANTLLAGGRSLLVTVTDNNTLYNNTNISLTVGTTNLTWNGAATPGSSLWSSQNWVGSLAPGLTGDSLAFAGSTGLTPDMNANYSIAALTFNSGAGGFDLISSTASTLILTGNVTNNSANAQTLDTSVNLAVPVTVNAASGNVVLNGVVSGANTLTTSGSHTVALAGTNTFTGLVINSGTLALTGASQLDSTGTGSGTFTNSITDNGNLTYNSSAVNTLAGQISGSGTLTVQGTNMTLTASNNYSGGTKIYGGILNVVGTVGGSSGIQSPLGSGSLTLSNGTLVSYQTSQGGVISNNTVCVSGTTNGITLNVLTGKATYWAGSITGSSGELDFGGTNTASGQDSIDLAGDNSSGNSGVFKAVSNLNLRLRNAAAGNTPNVAWDLGNVGAALTTKVDGTPTTFYLGALTGGSSSTLSGHASSAGGTGAYVTYQIGARNLSTTFAGVISDGNQAGSPTNINNTSIIKVGSGTLNLTGTSTYTGNTTISGGTLELANADLATNSTVTVTSGGTLQLDFTTTNIVSALVLNGTSQSGGVYGSANSGGRITGTGYLQIVTTGPTGPGYITNSISGSTLTLTWPAGQGWRLVGQTNDIATGLSTNWTTVSGPGVSDGSATITVDPAKPTVFYELVNP